MNDEHRNGGHTSDGHMNDQFADDEYADHESAVSEALARLVPQPPTRGNLAAVVHRLARRRRQQRSAAAATLAAVAVAAVVATPLLLTTSPTGTPIAGTSPAATTTSRQLTATAPTLTATGACAVSDVTVTPWDYFGPYVQPKPLSPLPKTNKLTVTVAGGFRLTTSQKCAKNLRLDEAGGSRVLRQGGASDATRPGDVDVPWAADIVGTETLDLSFFHCSPPGAPCPLPPPVAKIVVQVVPGLCGATSRAQLFAHWPPPPSCPPGASPPPSSG